MPLSVSLWNDLSDPVFDGVGLAGFKIRANAFLLAWSALSFLSPTVLSFFSFHGLVVWGWGLWTDIVFSLSPGLAQRTPNNNNNNNYASDSLVTIRDAVSSTGYQDSRQIKKYIIIIIITKCRQLLEHARPHFRRGRFTLYQSEDPSPITKLLKKIRERENRRRRLWSEQ